MITFTDCKINLGLRILRRRPDGYHDISTCMLPVPWHDIIEIIPSKYNETTLTVLGNSVDCPPEKNLVMKAYRALCDFYPLPPVDITLQKIVPDGAGLGGGSADAAKTLTTLNTLFNLGLPKSRLAEIATTIGADCPFFVYDTPKICEGIGEKMSDIHINLKGMTIVIAKPLGVCVSTKEAYSGVAPHEPECDLRQLLALPVNQWQGNIVNDFEQSIFAKAPQVAELKSTMISLGAVYASMSGSGASVYGIFDNAKMAVSAYSQLSGMPSFIFSL